MTTSWTDAEGMLPRSCDWCPRACGANRAAGQRGVCGAGAQVRVARSALHFWEEPPISGLAGSGTIFFSYCPLRCVYCQNRPIALGDAGADVSLGRLVELMLEQQQLGALNVNMVTPTHYGPLIAAAVRQARAQGLDLPVCWNTAGYETVAAIRGLRGVADVFLTDFKYADAEMARAFSHAADYLQVALAALDCMVELSGEPRYDSVPFRGEGGQVQMQQRMTRGVIVRHLLMPGHLDNSLAVVQLLQKRYGNAVRLSLMNQYTPVLGPDSPAAQAHPELLEHPSREDYECLLDFADTIGVQDYFWQDGQADEESFIPAFDLTGVMPE
ncbi:MAG: radical SAM protein [Coriobacteriia bacterium]|nr:radical SAM protein [Coriobacteriia bacterium]